MVMGWVSKVDGSEVWRGRNLSGWKDRMAGHLEIQRQGGRAARRLWDCNPAGGARALTEQAKKMDNV